MAGVSFRVDLDDADARRALGRVQAAGGDMTPAMDDTGRYLVIATQLRFERGVGPDGKAWPPSIRAQNTGGKTLLDSGRLANSHSSRAGRNSVEVGTNVIYARIHQLGGKAGRNLAVKLPPRPFLGVDADDETEIREIFRDHLVGGIA